MVYMVTEKNVLFRSEKHFLKGCKKKNTYNTLSCLILYINLRIPSKLLYGNLSKSKMCIFKYLIIIIPVNLQQNLQYDIFTPIQ